MQLAFELYAYLELSNYHVVPFRDPIALARGRTSVSDRLDHAATVGGRAKRAAPRRSGPPRRASR